MVVCLDGMKGGLGVICLVYSIGPFYVNGVWCFADKRDALWKQVIDGKYGVKDGGWSIRAVRDGYGVGLWKVIKKEGNLE